MKRFTILLMLLLSFGKPVVFSQPVIIKGSILKSGAHQIFIENASLPEQRDTIEVVDGKINHKLFIQYPGIWNIYFGNSGPTNLFLSPGYELSISSNPQDSNLVIDFVKEGNVENDILDTLNRQDLSGWCFSNALKMEYEAGNRLIDSSYQSNLKNFDKFVKAHPISSTFETLMRKNFIYEATSVKLSLAMQSLVDSNRFPSIDFVKNIPLEDPTMLGFPSYAGLLNLWLNTLPRPNYDSLPPSEARKAFETNYIRAIQQIKNDSVRQFLLLSQVLMGLRFQDASQISAMLDYFKKTNTNALYARFVNKKLSFSNGSRAPNFSLADASGQMHTLDEFRGRYVFIDFWATWCGPCIKEMPAFHQLQEDYKDAPIVFLSISIDHDLAVWKTFLEKHRPNNLNLICQQIPDAKGFENPIAKAYQVIGIPAFVLIDPQGKLAHTRTTKPSDVQHIHELFDGFLKMK